MAKGVRSPGGAGIVYASSDLWTFRMGEDVPEPVLSEQLVERLVPLPWGFEGSLQEWRHCQIENAEQSGFFFWVRSPTRQDQRLA